LVAKISELRAAFWVTVRLHTPEVFAVVSLGSKHPTVILSSFMNVTIHQGLHWHNEKGADGWCPRRNV
jgi:hypothetical protein